MADGSPIVPTAALTRVRKRTESMDRLSKRELEFGRVAYDEDVSAEKPRTWGECKARGLGVVRPCVYISCAHHLALDVNDETGSIITNFPDRDPWDLPETCVLAVVGRNPDGMTLEAIGALLNLTMERVRMLEERHLEALRAEFASLRRREGAPR